MNPTNEQTRICAACGDANPTVSKFCNHCGAKLEDAAADAAPTDPLIGRVLLDRYRITGEIGEGGMGKVYMAAQKMGNASRSVAVKTLHPELSHDPQIVARFRRESETVIQLTHPNTIQFYDFGELEDGTLFIVMEFIKGESLARILESGALSSPRIDKILVQVCGSLAEAHDIGVVHRDLKPDNILLTNRGGQTDFVKVLDFGIAKRSEAEDAKSTRLTKQGMVLGTPPYMSPEQFSGVALDARSDIYSLGLITYEMITGQLPFSANSPWEWATQHLTATPKPLSEHPAGAQLAPQKVAAVMRALSRSRDDRQPTILDFMREFTGLADAQAAWTMVTTPGGTPSHKPAVNPYTPTGFAAVPAANTAETRGRGPVGTPEPMMETGEIEAALLGGGKAKPWGLGSVMKLAAVAGLLLGVGMFFYLRSSTAEEPSTETTASAGDVPPAQANTGETPPQNGIPSTPPATPTEPAVEPKPAVPEDTKTDAKDEQGGKKNNGHGSTKPSSGTSNGGGSGSGTSTPTPPVVKPADPEPPATTPTTTPTPKPDPEPPTPTPPTTPTTPPVTPGPITIPPSSIGGTRPVSPGVVVVAPSTQIKAPATPKPTTERSVKALEKEGISAISRNDFDTAIRNLKEIRKLDPQGGKSLQNTLGRSGANRIRELVATDCRGAQRLYKALDAAGASVSAATRYFKGTCAVPR